MARTTHPAPTPSADTETVQALAELSIEKLIRDRVALMLSRLGDAHVADLYELVMRETERGLLGLMLDRCRGNRGLAAEQLGLHRNTLRQKIDKLGLARNATARKRKAAH
jgi:DNA-binding protein Fis